MTISTTYEALKTISLNEFAVMPLQFSATHQPQVRRYKERASHQYWHK
jgi:hypothetical protein